MRLILVFVAAFAFIASAWAADEPRKVDFTTVLTDQDGKDLTECADDPAPRDPRDCASRRAITLGAVVLRALVMPEQGLSPEDAAKRGALGLELYKSTGTVLTPEDIILLKKHIAKQFSPLVSIRAFRLIDPTVK